MRITMENQRWSDAPELLADSVCRLVEIPPPTPKHSKNEYLSSFGQPACLFHSIPSVSQLDQFGRNSCSGKGLERVYACASVRTIARSLSLGNSLANPKSGLINHNTTCW